MRRPAGPLAVVQEQYVYEQFESVIDTFNVAHALKRT